jgi:hypothetical protein
MKTNNKLKPQIPYTRHTYQTKGGLFVLLYELDISKRQAVKARCSQDTRAMVQALMVWGDDGGAVVSTTINEIKMEKKS